MSSSSATCASGVIETYTYDEAGNRTADGTRDFTYDAQGQLATCDTSPACAPVFDDEGRLTAITNQAADSWTYAYDEEGRLITACKATSCSGTPARLDFTLDGSGQRIRIVETPSGASPTTVTTDFSYDGETVIREVATSSAGPITTRTFTTDEAGAIHKMTVVTTGGGSTADDGTYLVTYNGHGDAIGLAEIDATDGHLTPAARITYSTWGTPTVTAQSGYGALGFRYLYVGRFDVQWDDFASAGLHYMHARHYSPEFGRFLQPDPSRLDLNLYAYGANSPVSKVDPSGRESSYYERTPEEDRLCRLYRRQCADWEETAIAAFAWTKVQYPGYIRNAMRHCIWQCLLTARSGIGWASLWARAHEARKPTTPFEKRDQIVDRHNNTVGQSLGLRGNLGWARAIKARNQCIEEFNAGRLQVNYNGAVRWSDGRPVVKSMNKIL